MAVKKSIAIIGEGETEWFYFDSLRIACRYPFKVAPDFPQHSDIPHMAKLAESYVRCEMDTYLRIRKKSSRKIVWVETNPCTEFWFLLHFLPQLSVKHYDSYEQLIPELQRYMPSYEKTVRYFRKIKLYNYLTENGDLQRALSYAKELSRLSEATPEDKIAYTQMHRVFELIASMNEDETCKKNIIPNEQISMGDNQQNIIDFIANNGKSDLKSISKATGLKVSRARDYLKMLVDKGLLEVEGNYKNKLYKQKKIPKI